MKIYKIRDIQRDCYVDKGLWSTMNDGHIWAKVSHARAAITQGCKTSIARHPKDYLIEEHELVFIRNYPSKKGVCE